MLGHEVDFAQNSVLLQSFSLHFHEHGGEDRGHKVARVDCGKAPAVPWNRTLSCSKNAELIEKLARLIEDVAQSRRCIPLGFDDFLMRAFILVINNLPIVPKLVNDILLIPWQIIKNTIKLNSFDKVLAELNEWKPLSNCFYQSTILIWGLELLKVGLELHRHFLKKVWVKLVLLDLPMVLLHNFEVELLV